MDSKPVIENETWQKLIKKNELLREAVMNPNTDFMTKLIFDAKFLQTKNLQELTHWSNLIVKIKLLLSEKKGLSMKEITKKLKESESDVQIVLAYLKGMAEVLETKEKYSINANNAFSKMFV
ncbi:MAG TPA: hypothetical protein VFF13_03880 [archaeon]|nr:hypothetical protein [archaeon]